MYKNEKNFNRRIALLGISLEKIQFGSFDRLINKSIQNKKTYQINNNSIEKIIRMQE